MKSKLLICILAVALSLIGFVAISMRGTTPDAYGWSITHKNHGNYYVRIESGIISPYSQGQDIVLITLRQHVEVYINGERILSSRENGRQNPVPSIYRIRVYEELAGKEINLIFSTPHPRENYLMRNTLSFILVNPGIAALDYSMIAISFVTGVVAIIIAFILGIKSAKSILLYALINFSFALAILWGTISDPRLSYILNRFIYQLYMLPMLAFFLLVITGTWRKYAIAIALLPVVYTVASFALHTARILPFGLTDGGYNYVAGFSLGVLIIMLAIQPSQKNRFSVIARFHLAVWMLWILSIVTRLLVFDMSVSVNVEYHLMYGFTLLSLTFYGTYMYVKRIKDLQLSESLMSIKAENLLLYFEQTNEYIHNVNSLSHDIKKHLVALHILIKDKKYDDAKAYLEKYTQEAGEIAQAVYHSNYHVNAVVHYLMHRAKSMGVKVNLNLKASPVSISEPDIISLLNNISDNALEACAKLEQGSFINFSLTRREPYFVIVCENSNPGDIITDNTKEGRVLTSKTKDGHGYGLKIIERIAASYSGMTEISYNENTFSITVILKDEAQ
jgi:hypothetical protein